MTSQGIDGRRQTWFARDMRGNPSPVPERRFDRTVRAVMWLDAFLSVALVVVCIVATPVLATLGVPGGVRFALGLSAIVCGVLLAAFGAITAVLLMMRMHGGDYFLPSQLRLP